MPGVVSSGIILSEIIVKLLTLIRNTLWLLDTCRLKYAECNILCSSPTSKTGDQRWLKRTEQTQALYVLLSVEHCVYASLRSPMLSTENRDMKPVVSTSSNVWKDVDGQKCWDTERTRNVHKGRFKKRRYNFGLAVCNVSAENTGYFVCTSLNQKTWNSTTVIKVFELLRHWTARGDGIKVKKGS